LRQFFGVSIDTLGKKTSWREAVLLVAALLQMPESRLQATMSKWKHPVSREWILLRDIFDLQATAQAKKKPKPYPAPWKQNNGTTLGRADQPRGHVLKQLKRMNSNLEA
jgi:hypothetical protein